MSEGSKPTAGSKGGKSPDWTASRAVFVRSFVGQAVAVVALAHAALLPLFYAGLLSALQFALGALVLCGIGLGIMAARLAHVLTDLHAVLLRFGAAPVPKSTLRGTWWRTLQWLIRDFKYAHRQTVEAQGRLESANEDSKREINASRSVAQQLIRAQRIAHVGSWEWERAADRVACSDEMLHILGVDPRRFHPTPGAIQALVHADDRRAFRRWLIKLATGTPQQGLDVRVVAPEGELRHVHILGEALVGATGRVEGVAGTLQDATERTRAIQQIHRLAYFDVLTELPNRSRFHEKLAETLDSARRNATPFAIMFLDLDHFKRINDTLGHAVGDDLLRIIAQRLTRGLRGEDIAGLTPGKALERDVCRQGGDEFIVLLNGVATEPDASRAANRLLETLAQPIVIGEQEIFVSASIGIVLYPRDGDDLDSLLKNADVAMYHAKSEGRNRFFFYNDSMRAATAQRLSIEHDLRRAIEGEQFELHYQPQINVSTGQVIGIEALIRWNHPTLGLLAPSNFISIAEEAGLIMAIWEWVLVTALIQHNAWRQQGLPAVTIGVNLSSVQFSDPGLAERVREIARVVEVPLDCLELEVTESMLMEDFDAALKTLTALRAMGVKIAIDDFGTGYSSLSYLRRLPLDKLKLDQSFIRDAGESEGDAAITRAIVAMAQSLHLTVVAEGVETQAQIDFLGSLGCTTMQGFLLSRPLPAPAIAEILRENRAASALPIADSTDPVWASIIRSKAHSH